MKRRNQKDHVFSCNNKPEVTISVYDNGKKRSKWVGGIAVHGHGGESYSYDGFRTRALQEQTFELLVDRMPTIFVEGAPVKAATKPKEIEGIFDRFTSVFSEFFENGGLGANRTKRDPDPHPESVEAARGRLNIFLAENYPSECTNGNLSATRFAEWPADVAVKVIRALRHADENMRHELKKLADFLSERYTSHAKDGERTVDFAMRMLTPGNGTEEDWAQSRAAVRRLTETDSADSQGASSSSEFDERTDDSHAAAIAQRRDTSTEDVTKAHNQTHVRAGGKKLNLDGDIAEAERCLNEINAANLRALWPTVEADAREIGALRNFMKGDIAEGEHPAAAAIRRMNSLSAKIVQLGADVGRLTEANRRPVQWIRSVDGFPIDCPVGFAPDGEWQIISSDSGVVTWCRPMQATKVHHKPIVVLRSPKGAHNGRRGRACFVGDKLIAMWLDAGNGAERVQPDGIEWGDV